MFYLFTIKLSWYQCSFHVLIHFPGRVFSVLRPSGGHLSSYVLQPGEKLSLLITLSRGDCISWMVLYELS